MKSGWQVRSARRTRFRRDVDSALSLAERRERAALCAERGDGTSLEIAGFGRLETKLRRVKGLGVPAC